MGESTAVSTEMYMCMQSLVIVTAEAERDEGSSGSISARFKSARRAKSEHFAREASKLNGYTSTCGGRFSTLGSKPHLHEPDKDSRREVC